MADPRKPQAAEEDPRAFSDAQVLEEHSREEVARWKEEAIAKHRNWQSVMKNNYGRD